MIVFQSMTCLNPTKPFQLHALSNRFVILTGGYALKRSAAVHWLRSKYVEIKSFTFMCTICTGGGGGANLHRVQIICTTSKSWSKFAPGPNRLNTVYMAKIHLGANCAHEHGFFSRVRMIYVSSRKMKRESIVLCFKLDHSEYLYEMTIKWVR